MEELEKKITDSVEKHKHDLEQYCLSTFGSVDILQWKLFSKLSDSTTHLSQLLQCKETQNILGDRAVLEAFMTSGDVENGDWMRALDLLKSILRLDPHATKHPVKLKLAVAVALTFAMPVISYASRNEGKEIDPIRRYLNFASWWDMKPSPLFGMLDKLTCWHLRYVVGSFAEDDELEWARINIPLEFRSSEKIGKATFSMTKYRATNDDGVSIHNGPAFYNHRPRTLMLLHQEGGVCGAVSNFGAAACQAFGVPAMPIGQPGHCAFTWYTDEGWVLGNKIRGWDESKYHRRVQAHWSRSALFIRLINDAQTSEKYVLSEKLRLAAKFLDPVDRFKLLFSHVLSICPENYSTWQDVLHSAKEIGLIGNSFKNVAECKLVTVSGTENRAQNITENSGSEWWTGEQTAWIEIDLVTACIVDHMKIHWWGHTKANHFKIFAILENGDKILVKTEVDQTFDEGEENKKRNQWINISGWLVETCRIRLELFDGNKDPSKNKGMSFGLRQLQVFAIKTSDEEKASPISPVLLDADKALEEEVEIQVKESKGVRVISEGKHVRVSSTQERGKNITELSESQWWTGDETAWIEIDLKTACIVDHVKIHWWGHTKANHFKIFAITENGDKILVKTEEDQTFDEGEENKKRNQWINISGWLVETCRIRLELSDGNSDPSKNKGMSFGVRQVVIFGIEKNYLQKVIYKTKEMSGHSVDTVSEGKCSESWVELDLGNICLIKSVEIDWNSNIPAEQVSLTIKTASGKKRFNRLESLDQIGRRLWLNFSAEKFAVKSIKVIGVEFTNKMILEGKIRRLLKNHPFVVNTLVEK